MTGSLDKKGFSIRDVIYLMSFVLGLSGMYYTMSDRMGDAETLIATQSKEISELKEANKAYTGLPADVKKMQLDIAKNAKVTTAIYYGLLANGTIKPPQ